MAALPVSLSQVAGALTFDVTWVVTTTPITQVVQVEVASGAGWTPIWGPMPVQPGTTTLRVSPPVSAGQTLRAVVTVTYGDKTESGTSAALVVASGQPPLGGITGGGAPVAVGAPDVLHPNQISPYGDAGRRLAAKAAAAGAHYRASYLREQAAAVAKEALALESEIGQLQGLDLLKMVGAQMVAAPAVAGAVNQLSDTAAQPLPLPDLAQPIAELATATQQLILFQRILDWLGRTDILEFWYGLFAALVDDVAHLNADLTATKAFLRKAFLDPSLQAAATSLLHEMRGVVDAQVATICKEVEIALASATAAISGQARQLFASIDAPLLAGPVDATVPAEPSPADVLDPSPFDPVLADLRKSIDAQLDALRTQVAAATGSLQAADDLFVALMTTYVALPVLAAVGVAVAGGPPAAALLTAAVFIGGQELLHLVAKWLAGPIADQLAALTAKVDEAKTVLLRTAATATAVASTKLNVSGNAVVRQLHVTGLFLRELSHLAPDAFLTATGQLLTRQRDGLVHHAGQLALAAELAQGAEHATVFDAIRPDYTASPGRLPAAEQLPGGASPNRYLAQTLLNDLHRLDEQRLELVDGKEMLLTKRLSLAGLASTVSPTTLMGGGASALDPLTMLLSGEPVAFALDEGDLLDGTHPGAYRALVDDVRLLAYVTPPVAAPNAIEALVTHSGLSSTRVRRPGGAAEGYGEVALRTILSDEVVLRAYRDSWAAAQRWRSLPAAAGEATPRWWHALGVSLWRRVQAAASASDLPDISVMREDFKAALAGLHLHSVVDPATEKRSDVTIQIALDLALRIEWIGWIPKIHPPDATIGDPLKEEPTAADLGSWAPKLAAWLRDRCRSLPTNPLRRGLKWGDHVRLLDETEPSLRGLGYQTLVRRAEPQALATELVPVGIAAHDPAGQVLFAAAGAGAATAAHPERSRPFENLGVTGTWIVQLPDAADDTAGLLATTRLRDLVIEMDMRVCHDPELEAAIRFAKPRGRQLAGLVAGGGRGPLSMAGQLKSLAIAPGQRRTLQISLRGQRQRAWVAWQQAQEAIVARSLPGFTPEDGINTADVEAAKALEYYQGLRLLKAGGSTFRFEFATTPPANLAELATRVSIQPSQLGVGQQLAPLLPTMTGDEAGRLHSIGVAVVPTSSAPAAPATAPGSVRVGPSLEALLVTSSWSLRGMTMTPLAVDTGASTAGVSFADLFADPAGAYIELDMASALASGAVYDVLVTLVYSPPLAQLRPPTTEML